MRAAILMIAALSAAAPAVAASSPLVKGPYLQSASPTSMTVMFESRTEEAAVVEVTWPVKRRIEVPAQRMSEVLIDGLKSGSRYKYRVSIADEQFEGEFATAPTGGAPFTFVVYGDSRSNPSSHRRVVERVRAEVPDFLLGTGDMVNDGGRERDWQQFFDIESKLLAENPLYPAVGNHDRQGRGRTADNYRKYFAVPDNSPNPERYYAFTYGNSRFVILDSNAYSFALTDQTAWLEAQLQAAQLDDSIDHVFVTMHHPPFSVSLHGGQRELREAWTPLFEKYQVDAVFSGHDHAYSRAGRAGVRYFVSGGGGAPLYPRKRGSPVDEKATQYFERVNHYLKVHVFGSFVEVTAIRADGTVIETLSWGKVPARKKSKHGKSAAGPRTLPVARAPRIASPLPTGSDFGWLGVLGGVLVLLAGGVLWFNLRS